MVPDFATSMNSYTQSLAVPHSASFRKTLRLSPVPPWLPEPSQEVATAASGPHRQGFRQRPASLVVADFGCGDCRLASSIRNTVHCFDLASLDPRVTVCDMAQVPLEDESVDVAVFCLH